MQKNKLKKMSTQLIMLSLFCSISAQAAICPALDEIKTNCIKGKAYNVCTFTANQEGISWSDHEKYTGIDLPGKITDFIDVMFKATSVSKKQITGKLNSCVYQTKDGLEIFLDPKQTKVAIQLDGNWKKEKHKTYSCNTNIQSCKFNFIP